MESEEFMLLPANQLIDIISSDELNVRSEEQVFNAVMAWVKYSIQERRPQLPQVVIHSVTNLLLLSIIIIMKSHLVNSDVALVDWFCFNYFTPQGNEKISRWSSFSEHKLIVGHNLLYNSI